MTAVERHGEGKTLRGGEGGAAQLLDDLRAVGVEFTVAGDKLLYGAPPGALSDDLRAAMKAHKEELRALLGVARPGSAAGAGSASDGAPTVPTSESEESLVPIGGTVRIPLDDLVCGDFLERNRLRIVGGTAYPDGRTYRPTIYLAGDAG